MQPKPERRCGLGRLSVLAVAFCTGCGVDACARRLVRRRAVVGRIGQALLGSAEHLLRRGAIDAHRRITVEDAVVLDVWVIKASAPADAPPRGTAVILHGLWDSKARFLPMARHLAEMGYDAVLMDLRCHGRSTGQWITFGVKEHRDAKAVADALIAEGLVAPPLYVFGVSMGGATAVQYAAVEDRCRAVMAVAPFSDLKSVARRYVPLMSARKYEAVLARAGEIAGFDVAAAAPVEAARRLACPLLVVHGRLDAVVPWRQGRAVHDAAGGPKRMITVPWAGHSTILLGRSRWFAEQLDGLARGLPAEP